MGPKTLRKDDLHFLEVLEHNVAVAFDERPLGAEGIFCKGVAEKAASARMEICVAGGHYIVGFLAGRCLPISKEGSVLRPEGSHRRRACHLEEYADALCAERRCRPTLLRLRRISHQEQCG